MKVSAAKEAVRLFEFMRREIGLLRRATSGSPEPYEIVQDLLPTDDPVRYPKLAASIRASVAKYHEDRIAELRGRLECLGLDFDESDLRSNEKPKASDARLINLLLAGDEQESRGT